LAHIFTTKIADSCTHGIDIHTGSNHRINLPHIRAMMDEPETQQLAEAFGAPVIIDANVRDGSLRQAVMEKGMPVLLFEAGEALRFDELAIRTGLRGILSVMGRIGMLSRQNTPKLKTKSLIAKTSIWARAPFSGILRTKKMLGDIVRKDDHMGIISDPFGENTETVFAPESGIIIGRLNIPLVHEGDAIFHIACLDHDAPVEAALQEYQELIDSV
jgi:predicted deacylase